MSGKRARTRCIVLFKPPFPVQFPQNKYPTQVVYPKAWLLVEHSECLLVPSALTQIAIVHSYHLL